MDGDLQVCSLQVLFTTGSIPADSPAEVENLAKMQRGEHEML